MNINSISVNMILYYNVISTKVSKGIIRNSFTMWCSKEQDKAWKLGNHSTVIANKLMLAYEVVLYLGLTTRNRNKKEKLQMSNIITIINYEKKISRYSVSIVFDIQNYKYEFHYHTTIEILRFCSNVLKRPIRCHFYC